MGLKIALGIAEADLGKAEAEERGTHRSSPTTPQTTRGARTRTISTSFSPLDKCGNSRILEFPNWVTSSYYHPRKR